MSSDLATRMFFHVDCYSVWLFLHIHAMPFVMDNLLLLLLLLLLYLSLLKSQPLIKGLWFQSRSWNDAFLRNRLDLIHG